jgi:hypothetical protein
MFKASGSVFGDSILIDIIMFIGIILQSIADIFS